MKNLVTFPVRYVSHYQRVHETPTLVEAQKPWEIQDLLPSMNPLMITQYGAFHKWGTP